MRYGHMTWPEAKEINKDLVVLLPLGSCEQHGPHMPLITDTLLVTAMAEAVEQAMPDDVLLMPTLWIGMSDHHLPLAGTVTVNPELYTQFLVRTLKTIVKHGFRKIFMLNGHGGNDIPSKQAVTELFSQGIERRDLWIATAAYWHLAHPSVVKLSTEGIDGVKFESPMLTHADEWEYSLGLHVFPQLCHPDRVKAIPTSFKTDYYDVDVANYTIGLSTPFTAFIPTGAANRPELATPEKGKVLFKAMSGDVIKFMSEYKSWKEHPSLEDMGVL